MSTRGARLRKPADGAENLLHRRRLAEDFRGLAHRLRDLRLAPALVQRPPDQLDRLVDVERLRQVFVGAALESGDRAVEVGVGGHDDHRDRGMPRFHRLEQLQAGLPRHADIGDKDFQVRRRKAQRALPAPWKRNRTRCPRG